MFQNYNRIHIDVGANDGRAAIHYARVEPKTFVIAFEPVPDLCDRIRESTSNLKNFMLVDKCVSNYEGVTNFNISAISPYGDYGCSSLLPFSDDIDSKWPDRRDLRFIKAIQADVIRLDKWTEENGIPYISYLKIDTQGNDIKVLEGLGEKLYMVERGCLEAGTKPDILYVGQNTKEESISFLESNGFVIETIESNDIHNNEVNIHFKRK